MKTLFLGFLSLLEKGSAFLEKITKPMERRMAYFFCCFRILVSFFAEAMAVVFFIIQFRKQVPWDIRLVMILFLVIISFMIGAHIYMIVTRDLKHIRDTDPKKKKDPLKEKKIEF
jgi:hypothetical protein